MLIVGLGASGTSALRYLAREDASLLVTDSRAASPQTEALRQQFPQVEFRLGGFDAPQPLNQFEEAVVSPGVSLAEPFVQALLAAGVAVIGDVELFARAVNAPVIGITGSNGKSTVTTLVGQMAHAAGLRVQVGGNLGTPALDLLADDAQLYVLELSSFQLETTHTLVLKAAANLNLSQDHLDRHGSMAHYAAVKARIFAHCKLAIVNREDPLVMQSLTQQFPQCPQLSFGLDVSDGCHYGLSRAEGQLWLMQGKARLLALSALKVQGLHNAANALAALALAEAAGIPRAAAIEALLSFKGLPHRCEFVAEFAGVTYLDDSKGTNVGATLAALQGLDGPIVWLGGGQGKGQDFAPLAAPLQAKGRAAILFGQDAEAIAAVLHGVLPLHREATLDDSVKRAAALAQAGDRVLLSPACASLDQFANYVQRGQRFADCVRALS